MKNRKKVSKRSRPKRETLARMNEVGLTEECLEKYLEMFVYSRWDDICYKWQWSPAKGKGDWSRQRGGWYKKLIVMHLTGETSVALEPRNVIDYLMIDIDNHGHHDESVEERAARCTRAFDAAPLVYRSSHSGGLRLVYFLDRPYRAKDIQEYARRRLEERGVKVSSGFVEVRAVCSSDRLPFGDGSFVYDSVTFEPFYDLNLEGMIEYAFCLYKTEKLVLDIDESQVLLSRERAREFHENAPMLMRRGLPKTMATDEALWILLRFLVKLCGFSQDQAREYAESWLLEKHNGCSDSINMGDYSKNLSAINRKLDYLQKHPVRRSDWPEKRPEAPLSETDVRKILRLAHDYRSQRRLFRVLAYVKANGIPVPSSFCARRLVAGTPAEPLFGQDSACSRLWLCAIPARIWEELVSSSRQACVRFVKELMSRRICGIWSEADVETHRCRQYAFLFDYEEDGRSYLSLDEALAAMFEPRALKACYGRYRCDKLLERSRSDSLNCDKESIASVDSNHAA